MTRYQYTRIDGDEPCYQVKFWDVPWEEPKRIGECWRRLASDLGTPMSRTWSARIFTDPTIIGNGRTRDDAVDDCYEQVGGAGLMEKREHQENTALQDCHTHLNIADGALRNAMKAALDTDMDAKFIRDLGWALINTSDLLSQTDDVPRGRDR